MNNKWKTSVNELIKIFRGSLLSIIPWVEKAKINWNDNDAYDDCDEIVQSLYKNIVCNSLFKEFDRNRNIAKYDLRYQDYHDRSFIKVIIKDDIKQQYAFISFRSLITPLDTVEVAVLDEKNNVINFTTIKNENLEFYFVKQNMGDLEIINNITVIL